MTIASFSALRPPNEGYSPAAPVRVLNEAEDVADRVDDGA